MPLNNYDFDPVNYGNKCDLVRFNLPQEEAYSLTGAKIYMQVRKKPGQLAVIEYSTEKGGIKIIDEFTFEFESKLVEITPDTYMYDIKVVFIDGSGAPDPQTFIGGKFPVESTITIKKL